VEVEVEEPLVVEVVEQDCLDIKRAWQYRQDHMLLPLAPVVLADPHHKIEEAMVILVQLHSHQQ
jgi:hypothetical protein